MNFAQRETFTSFTAAVSEENDPCAAARVTYAVQEIGRFIPKVVQVKPLRCGNKYDAEHQGAEFSTGTELPFERQSRSNAAKQGYAFRLTHIIIETYFDVNCFLKYLTFGAGCDIIGAKK
jgi:hypothetical protein